MLSKDVLLGDNFQKWKSNLNIVLVGENLRYILNILRPPPPNNNATRLVREEYGYWVTSNNKAIAYILATMSDVLWEKFEVKETAVEILNSLYEIFGQKNKQTCIEIIGKYTTTRMKTGTPLGDHVYQYYRQTQLFEESYSEEVC